MPQTHLTLQTLIPHFKGIKPSDYRFRWEILVLHLMPAHLTRVVTLPSQISDVLTIRLQVAENLLTGSQSSFSQAHIIANIIPIYFQLSSLITSTDFKKCKIRNQGVNDTTILQLLNPIT